MPATHLTFSQKTNLGSFYTPSALVARIYKMLSPWLEDCDVLLDSSCGYGAFFEQPFPQNDIRKIGGDIDAEALSVAQDRFSDVSFFNINALENVSRELYGISPRERLVIVGNPPYNDITSRVKQHLKTSLPTPMDDDIRTRDFGISFLLSFEKLDADFVAVLHPLSYLIKESNFKLLAPFMRRYSLCETLVVNSLEFSDTMKGSGFPIVLAVYKKSAAGTSYQEIVRRKFRTIEGRVFSVSDFDYVCRYIPKYPARFSRNHAGAPNRYRFFTMRDINALKRSRTFIAEDSANTIIIPDGKLEYFCYVDIFKDFCATLPYFFGNFNVMFNRAEFEKIKSEFLVLSVAKHPDIFSKNFVQPTAARIAVAREHVRNYFSKLFSPTISHDDL